MNFLLIIIFFPCTVLSQTLSAVKDTDNPKKVEPDFSQLLISALSPSLALGLVSCLANAGGMGGSSKLISVLLLFGFSISQAIAGTLLVVFVGAGAAVTLQLGSRHPHKDRPLIDFDLLLMVAAPMVAGVRLGSWLNQALPDAAVMGLIGTVALVSLCDLVEKTRKLHWAEQGRNWNGKESSMVSLLRKLWRNKQEISQNNREKQEEGIEMDRWWERGEVRKGESKSVLYFIAMILAVFAMSIGYMQLMRMVEKVEEQVYLSVAYLGALCLIICLVSMYLLQKSKNSTSVSANPDDKEINWTGKTCFFTVVLGIISGTLVGLLGTGGGNVIRPMLLSLNVIPEVAFATHSFAIFIAAGTAVLYYFLQSSISYSLSFMFVAASLCGSMTGILVLRKTTIKHGKMFLLMSLLTIMLAASISVVWTFGVIEIINMM
jgi:uncharacterized membrane protein YfcA